MSMRRQWVKFNDAGGSALISRRKVICPETCTLGFAKLEARAGDLIEYRYEGDSGSGVLARVLGIVEDVKPADQYPNVKRGMLLVLQLSSCGTFAYMRVVAPEQVRFVHSSDRLALLAWFARPNLADDPVSVGNYSAYGSLSAGYIESHCQDGRLIPWQDSNGNPPAIPAK